MMDPHNWEKDELRKTHPSKTSYGGTPGNVDDGPGVWGRDELRKTHPFDFAQGRL